MSKIYIKKLKTTINEDQWVVFMEKDGIKQAIPFTCYTFAKQYFNALNSPILFPIYWEYNLKNFPNSFAIYSQYL